MIGALLDFLRRSTGQVSITGSVDDAAWKSNFESLLKRSEEKPRLLVDFARKGFPNAPRGWAWCRVLRTDEVPAYLRDFESELYRLFGTNEPVHFQPPCFGSPLDWANINLSTHKKDTIKKLLCIVGDSHPQLEYAPIIPAIVAVLSKRLDPNDVLACIAAVIEGHSIPAFKRQDWAYFPNHRRDHLVFERVFEDLTKNCAPKVSRHISKIQLVHPDFAPSWDNILSTLFIGILPREIVLRIFDCYLVEGYKVLLRFAIAHVIIRQELLLATKEPKEINEIITRPDVYTPGLLESYFRTAFNVKFDRSIIQRYRNRRRKHSIGDFDAEDRLLIFQRPLPQLLKRSSILRDDDWAALWNWVPARFKLLNLNRVFTTAEDGKHLTTLLKNTNELEPILLLIETVSGKVFGAYISKALSLHNGPSFYGTGETFLFSLRPTLAKYEWNLKSKNTAFVCVTESFLALGAGADFGLWLDRFLTSVTSGHSVTFDNEPLVDKNISEDLQIYCIEIFHFV
jgi:hypothetical protein